MIRRNPALLTAALLLLSAAPGFAQSTGRTFAAGGPLGIYVALGVDLPNPSREMSGGVAYLVERRASGEQAWQQVGRVTSPASLDEFRSRLAADERMVPDSISLDPALVDTLFARIQKYGFGDSLRFWSGVLLVRLASGMMYLDTSAQKGVEYQYRVSLVGPSGNRIRSLLSNAASYPGTVHLPKLDLYDKRSTERQVIIQWTSGTVRGASLFKAYRQEGLRGDFSTAVVSRFVSADRDSIFYSIQDTLVQPLQAYRYYLMPMDYYGNPGAPSDTVLVGAYDFRNVPLPDNFYVASVDSPAAGIHIGWRLGNPRLVRNLSIYRSVDYDTGYHKLSDIATSDTSYVDQTAKAMQRYFYYLVMTGPLGEKSPRSARVFGMYVSPVAPVPPGIVAVQGTSHGVRFGIMRTDANQVNYQVYRNDGIRPALSLISGLVPQRDSITFYEDTSSVLSGSLTYSYSVRAENASHVFSGFSDTVHVRPNLPTHPPTPLGLTATVEGRFIQLYWNDMRPSDHTISGYFVFRREILSGKRRSAFVKLNDTLLSSSVNRFTDTTAAAGRKYEYAVRDRDFFGGESAMSTVAASEVPEIMPIAPGGLRAHSTRTGIVLQWDRTVQPGVTEYRVYRYQRRGRPERISTVRSSGSLETLDRRTRRGDLYFYFVTAVNERGVESSRSGEVSVRR